MRANNVNMGVREITSFFSPGVKKRSGGGLLPPPEKRNR